MPPSTSVTASTTARSNWPRRSRRASSRSTSRPSARSSCTPDIASGSSSSSSTPLRRLARAQRAVAPLRQLPGEQAGLAEAVSHRGARQRRQLAERLDAEPAERLRQRRRLRAPAQQPRPAARRGSRARRARAQTTCGRRARARVAAASAQKREGPAPIRAGVASALRAAASTWSSVPPRPHEALRLEAGEAGPLRLDRGADRLEPHDQPLPGVGDAGRVGRHERQLRAARERLPSGIPARTPNASAASVTSPTRCSRAALGRERGRLAEQLSAVARGDGELEAAGDQNADDHRHEQMFASMVA